MLTTLLVATMLSDLTSGAGIAVRAGVMYGGVSTSSGAIANLRVEKLELVAGAMQSRSIGEDSSTYPSRLYSSYDIEQQQIDERIFDAGVRWHPGNGSFYFGFMGAHRKVTGVLRASSGGSAVVIDEKVVADVDSGLVSIGNIWTPGGTQIGCEWVGFGGKVQQKTTRSGSTEEPPASETGLSHAHATFMKQLDTASNSFNSVLVVHVGFMLGS